MRSSVRCGREVWPPRPVKPDVEGVGGAGERTLAQPDLADVDGRVAVQPEDPVDVVEGAGRHQLRARRRA